MTRARLINIISRWPAKIRHEIGRWLDAAKSGPHGNLSKPVARRWRYLLTRLDKVKK